MNELWTIIIAASPIVELRGAIPMAMGIFNFSWSKALFLSLMGNLLPVIPLLWFLDKLSGYLSERFVFLINSLPGYLQELERKQLIVLIVGVNGL